MKSIFKAQSFLTFIVLFALNKGYANSRFDQLTQVANSQDSNSVCHKNEIDFEKTGEAFFKNFEREILKSSKADFVPFFSKKINVSDWNKIQNLKPAGDNPNSQRLLVYFKSGEPVTELEAALAARNFKSYLTSFKKIEFTDLEIFQINKNSDQSVVYKARLSVDGFNQENQKRSDRLMLTFKTNGQATRPEFNEIELNQFQSVVNTDQPYFEKASFGNNLRTDLRLEAIRRGGYALAVGDYNNDGNQDLLVGHYGPMQVFSGDGKGGFKEQVVKGLSLFTLVKSAAWADLDNDGDQDLVLVRFIQDNDKQNNSFRTAKLSPPSSAVLVFENKGNGQFAEVKQKLNAAKVTLEKAMPMALADFNSDGLLDLYVGYPGANDFTALTAANNPQKYGHLVQAIYLNKGDLVFEAKTMSTSVYDVYEKFSRDNIVYPHSALALDIDANGSQDIVVIDDRDNPTPFYLNDGQGSFKESGAALGLKTQGWGMGAAAADLNGDGVMDLAFSSVTDSSEKRWSACINKASGGPTGLVLNLSEIDKKTKTLKFSSWKGSDLDFPGQGAANLEFLDYDLDGQPDLYVTNGLWSGADKFKSIDLFSRFRRVLKADANAMLDDDHSSTRSFIMETLQEKQRGHDLTMAGYQSNRLYKMYKNVFVDVAFVEGVGSLSDGYGVAKGDFNNDGIPDLILRNADPGTTRVKTKAVELYLGRKTKNHVLSLALVASEKNKDAIGAKVVVKTTAGPQQTQVVMGNNGCLQSEKTLFFGLGPSDFAESVEITWPNGQVEKILGLKSGQHTIKQKTKIGSL